MEQIKKLESSRILWIDGIKGLSCIFIFLHHSFLGLFPATYFGASRESHLFGIDTFLSSSPLGFFLNGNFFVFLYIFISGYVITYQSLRMQPADFGIFHFKRYLKLMFPLLIYCFIFFAVNIINSDILSEMTKNNKYTFFMTVKMALYKILFFSNTTYGGHFWMMGYIFLGGIFTSVIASTTWSLKPEKVFLIAIFFAAILFLNLTLYYPAIFLGCAYCIFRTFNIPKFQWLKTSHILNSKLIFWLFFILAIIFGAYPSEFLPNNFYKYITLPLIPNDSAHFYHMIAAVLLIAAVENLPKLQAFFESKICLWLAKISYAVYIFHILVLFIMRPLFNFAYKQTNNYILSASINLLLSSFMTITASYFLTKYLFIPFWAFVNKKANAYRDDFLKESR